MNKVEFTEEILDKIKEMLPCIDEFTSIDDIEQEVIESMKDIKRVNDI